jgi:hypothetical protein
MNIIRKALLLSIAIGAFTSAHADSITVTVRCSNGQAVKNLSVAVRDSLGDDIPNLLPTNSKGTFVIENSELYTPPFYLWYQTSQGSVCGSYYINLTQPNQGLVQLNYYPTELPCSCSNLSS